MNLDSRVCTVLWLAFLFTQLLKQIIQIDQVSALFCKLFNKFSQIISVKIL